MKEKDEEYPTADEKAGDIDEVVRNTATHVVDGKNNINLLINYLEEQIPLEIARQRVTRAPNFEAEAKETDPEELAERHMFLIMEAAERYSKKEDGDLAMDILRW